MVGFDLLPFIKSVGYLGIFASLFLENGVLIFFFLPGDSLLLTAGFLAGQGLLDIKVLITGGLIVAILGYMMGYYIGQKFGLKLFEKENARYLKQEHLEKARQFYHKHGSLALVLVRFLPLRSFVCFLAGVTEMHYGKFMLYNVIGAVLWAVCLPLVGFHLGQIIPVSNLRLLYLVPVLAVLATVFCVPFLTHLYKKKNKVTQKD